MVRTKGAHRRVLHSELQYAELCGRCVHYHLTGGETLESVSLQKSFRDEVADFLADPAFLLCGASYLINLAFVTQVDKSFLYMKDGTRVPLPRKNAPRSGRRGWSSGWEVAPLESLRWRHLQHPALPGEFSGYAGYAVIP